MKKIYYTLVASLLSLSGWAQTTCETALTITAGTHLEDTLRGVPHSSFCIATGNATAAEWYRYVPTDTFNVTVSTDLVINEGIDTRFSVYSGDCSSLVCVGGDDDGGTGYLSIGSFVAVPGTVYYIMFDSRWSRRGFTFELIENEYVGPAPTVGMSFNQVPVSIAGSFRIAVADMNGDFLDDIIAVSSDNIQIAFQYQNNQFITSTYPVNITFTPNWSMAIGDLDGNGFNDVVLGNGSGVSFLFANDDGWGYRHESNPRYVFSQRSNMVDLNNDGHLDAFVCHDVAPNVYYINDGQGSFEYFQGGIGDHENGGNYGSIWTDYNNDGFVDLLIAKCRGGGSTAKLNQLLKNNGDGTFTEVSVEANVNQPNQSWSAAVNDFDGDGWMDAFIGANSMSDGGHLLLMNNQDGTFSDQIAQTTINPTADGHAEWISQDFDNNGWPDIFSGSNKIILNHGDLSFSIANIPAGFGAVGDLNNDGFLDIQVGGAVFFQQPNENNWLKVNVKGTASNVNGIGSRVELYAGGRKQIRDIQSGTGFRYMHTLNAHFGLGEVTTVDSVIVRWPSGNIDVIRDVQPNGALLVVEGNSTLGNLQVTLEGVKLYPNPTNGILKIDNIDKHDVKEIQVMNLGGQVVYSTGFNFAEHNLEQLTSGMYVVNILLANGTAYNELIVIQK